MTRWNKKGHNLLEVTIAAFVFSTAAILMIGVWGIYHQALNQNKNRLMASAVCKAEVESMVAQGYGNLEPFFYNNLSQAAPVGNGQGYQSFTFNFDSWVRGREVITNYTANVTIYDCSLSPAQGGPPGGGGGPLYQRICHVLCTVFWAEQTGQKNLTYDCYLFGSR